MPGRVVPARIIIDTNTFLSASIRLGSIPFLAVERALANSVILMSTETWQELEDVLLRGKFDRYQAFALRQNFLRNLESYLELISVLTKVSACRHPKDDKFLELAIDGRADVLITGDKDLLTLHPFRGITILTPAAYLEM